MDAAEFAKRYVVRFNDIQPAAGAPPDAQLPRFVRERLMVLGRKSERRTEDAGPDLDAGINIAYVRCESGKGFCSHAHPSWEIFVPMTGRWAISQDGGGDIEIGPWDAVAVAGGVFHGAMNVSDGQAVMMSINPGGDTAPYTIAADVLEEIARFKSAKA